MDNSAANTDLIRGHVITIILRSLQGNDKYGYEICREIEVKSEGSYVLKQPTLYSCLKRLESQGYITSYFGEISNGGRRRYYSLTPKGEEYLERDKQEWEFSRTLINRLLSDKDYDLTQPPPFNPSDLRPYTRKLNEAAKAEKAIETEESESPAVEVAPVADEPVIVEENEVLSEQINADENAVEEVESVVEEVAETIDSEDIVEEPQDEVEESEVEEELVEEEPAPVKTSFSIFDLMPTAEDEEKVEQVDDEEEEVSYVVPLTHDTVDEDDLVAVEEEEEVEEEESEAAKIIAEAYDPHYGESYSEGVSHETAFSKLFDNNNSTNEFFGIEEEKEEQVDEEEERYVGFEDTTKEEEESPAFTPADLFTAPVEEESSEDSYEIEENYYVVPNREVSAYQSEQFAPKASAETMVEEIIEDLVKPQEEINFFGNNEIKSEDKTTEGEDALNYKNAFSKLFNEDEQRKIEPKREVVINNKEVEIKMTRDLPPVASMTDLKKHYYSEGYNLKPYNRSNTEIYYNMNYMYANKLSLATYWIMYAIILVEMGLTALIDNGRVLGGLFYILVPILGLIVPGVPTILWFRDPMKRVKAEFDLKWSLLWRSLLFMTSSIVVFGVGVICGVSVVEFDQIMKYILLPIIYLLNIPLSSLIYYWMFNTKKFHLN